MADKLNIELNKPRTCGRQAKRDNYSVDGIGIWDYYRVSTYIHLLETVINDLKTCFPQEVLDAFKLTLLLLKSVISLNSVQIKELLFPSLKGLPTYWKESQTHKF